VPRRRIIPPHRRLRRSARCHPTCRHLNLGRCCPVQQSSACVSNFHSPGTVSQFPLQRPNPKLINTPTSKDGSILFHSPGRHGRPPARRQPRHGISSGTPRYGKTSRPKILSQDINYSTWSKKRKQAYHLWPWCRIPMRFEISLPIVHTIFDLLINYDG
jgi:hypothetical protein